MLKKTHSILIHLFIPMFTLIGTQSVFSRKKKECNKEKRKGKKSVKTQPTNRTPYPL